MGLLFRDTRELVKAIGRAISGECGHSFKYFPPSAEVSTTGSRQHGVLTTGPPGKSFEVDEITFMINKLKLGNLPMILC